MATTFYTLLQALIHPQIDEYLTVGLLLCGPAGEVYFAVSEEKSQAAKSVISGGAARLLQHSLNDLERTLKPAPPSGPLPFGQSVPSRFTQPDYLHYTTRYHHNLLRFAPPVSLSMPATQETFTGLFRALVFDKDPQETAPAAPISPFERLKTEFYPNITKRVNTDFTLTPALLPTLFISAEVSFIGENNVPVVGQEIDFAKRSYNLGKDLNDMYALIKAFEAERKGVQGKYYLIGDEPSPKLQKQHEMWQTVRRSPFAEVVPIDESARIIEYLEQHDVQPFYSL